MRQDLNYCLDYHKGEKGGQWTYDTKSAEVQEKIRILRDYYTSDQWLVDYEMDEKELLPADLKRGVLSQDGVYNLLGKLEGYEE